MNVISITKLNTRIAAGYRNSLFELYRFLFAMWIVWYHGYFIFKNQYFDDGYIAVEFFFLLSGFYYLKTLDKYKDKKFFEGIFQIIISKVKSFGFAFVVGLLFVAWQRILEEKPVLLGYLWYIPIMLLAFALIYLMKRLIKRESIFIISLIGVVIINYLILYVPIIEKFGVSRGLGAVSLGVLISYLPKIEIKISKLSLNLILTISVLCSVIYLAYLPKNGLMYEHLLIFVCMPMLIYFTNTLKINSKVLNFFGSLSFALYSYQCVVRVLRMIFTMPQYVYFVILICLVALDRIINTMVKNHFQNRKMKIGT